MATSVDDTTSISYITGDDETVVGDQNEEASLRKIQDHHSDSESQSHEIVALKKKAEAAEVWLDDWLLILSVKSWKPYQWFISEPCQRWLSGVRNMIHMMARLEFIVFSVL